MDQSCGEVLLQSDGPPKQFTFDGVYYMDSTAEQIYNDIVYPLVEVNILPFLSYYKCSHLYSSH